MSAKTVKKERETVAPINYEGEAREASVVVEKMREEYVEAGKFLNLASTNANVLSDLTVQGFREKGDMENTNLVNTYMNGVRDVLAQDDSAPTGVLS